MPDLSDPIFIAYAQKLLNALGARYDGNPNLAFVDIGMVGSWGNGTTQFTDVAPLLEKYAPEQLNRYVDMHFSSFPKTPKIMLISGGNSLAWASQKGAGGAQIAGETGITFPQSGAICAMTILNAWPRRRPRGPGLMIAGSTPR